MTTLTTISERAKLWYIRYPGDSYPLGPLYFKKMVTKDEVKRHALKFTNWWNGTQLKRLPSGFECWPTI